MTKEEYAMKEEFAAVSARTVKSELTNLEEELYALSSAAGEVSVRYSAAARPPENLPSAALQKDEGGSDSDLLRAIQSLSQTVRSIRYDLEDFAARSQL